MFRKLINCMNLLSHIQNDEYITFIFFFWEGFFFFLFLPHIKPLIQETGAGRFNCKQLNQWIPVSKICGDPTTISCFQ